MPYHPPVKEDGDPGFSGERITGPELTRRRMRREVWGFLLVVAAVATITFLRAPESYRFPSFNAEEGNIFFPIFYNGVRLGDVLYWPVLFYAMAVPIGIGWAISLLPVRHMPSAMVLAPLALVSVTFAWLALPRHRALFPTDGFRVVLCLVLAILPLAHYSLVSTVMSTHWIGFLALTLMLLVPLPSSTISRVVQVGAMAMVVWSHPLCLALLPAFAYRAATARSRGERGTLLALAALACLFPLLGTYHADSRGASLAAGRVVATSFQVLAQKVVFESIFGNRLREVVLARWGTWPFATVFAIVVGACGLAVWTTRRDRDREQWFLLGYAAYLCVVLPVLVVVLRGYPLDALLSDWSQIYTFVPKVYVLLLLCMVGTALGRGRDWGLRWGRYAAVAALAWAGSVAVFNQSPYRCGPEAGVLIQHTIARLYQAERATGGRDDVHLTVEDPIRRGWPIVIKTRSQWDTERRARPWTFWWLRRPDAE